MSNAKKANKPELSDLIKSAKLPERTIQHCVRGDIVADVERLERELSSLKTQDSRLTGNPEARALAEQIEALREEMSESVIEFTLRALPRRAFQKLLASHPARDDDKYDRSIGYNRETFVDALVRASVAAPEVSEEDWETIVDAMTAAQWEDFANVAAALNMEQVSVPFSRSASRILQASDER